MAAKVSYGSCDCNMSGSVMDSSCGVLEPIPRSVSYRECRVWAVSLMLVGIGLCEEISDQNILCRIFYSRWC